MTRTELLALETKDYQHRGSDYPMNNVPDRIEVSDFGEDRFMIHADFKNTTEDSAKHWLTKYADSHDLEVIREADAWQTGDYENDWVDADIVVRL